VIHRSSRPAIICCSFGLLLALWPACTYEGDSRYLRDAEDLARLQIVTTSPPPGATDASRASSIDIIFNVPPDAELVSARTVRLFSGLYETIGDLKVDLLDRRLRLRPDVLLPANLRHQVYLHADLAGINGARLGERIIFDFTTGTDTRTPAAPAATASSSEVQAIWRQTGCARAGCHGSASPAAGLILTDAATSRRSLVDAASSRPGRLLVAPGDHARSYLMLKLLGEGGIIGFPMPPIGAPLPRSKLRQVARWIDGGARP